MFITPDFAKFAHLYDAKIPQVLSTNLTADLETPVSGMMKLAGEQPNSFLLESVEGGAHRGRYSIIGMKPDIIWRCNGNKAEIGIVNEKSQFVFSAKPGDALNSLRELIDESRIDLPEGLPPMAAGLVGYLAYDTVTLMENIPSTRPDPIGCPDGLFIRPTIMTIFDLVSDTVTIVTPVRPEDDVPAKNAWDTAARRLLDSVKAFGKPLEREFITQEMSRPNLKPVSNTTKDDFIGMVRKAKEYILSGDIFQVVLSQRFCVPFTLSPFSLYRALRRTNPSPFLFFLNFDEFSVVGSSPEILVRMRDGKITIRPLAGTRPRGKTNTEDKALELDLLSDEKELAEHLMLLDLGRNDVGRVAKIGSVKVTEKNVVERYSHVMHISSNVEGKVEGSTGPMDALTAGFPAGTVSGAPKIRAMEIINELETEKRGIYAGTVGYFSANGSMDTCILLRTAIVKNNHMYIQAGAGIVSDSDPEAEYKECQNKAAALIRSAEEAFRYAEQTKFKSLCTDADN